MKHEAVTIVEKFLAQDDTKDRKLKEYAKTFFVWDECLWIRRQHAKGKRSSKTNATLRRDHLNNYILPKFGNRTLTSLNRVEIENWLVALKSIKTGKQLSNQTKNHILYAFRIVLREAERESIPPYNCLSIVESLAVHPKIRGVFSPRGTTEAVLKRPRVSSAYLERGRVCLFLFHLGYDWIEKR